MIKVINTLSALTCELGDEYSNSPVSDVQAENFYIQVKFINCYLREIISFAKKLTSETGASLHQRLHVYICLLNVLIFWRVETGHHRPTSETPFK